MEKPNLERDVERETSDIEKETRGEAIKRVAGKWARFGIGLAALSIGGAQVATAQEAMHDPGDPRTFEKPVELDTDAEQEILKYNGVAALAKSKAMVEHGNWSKVQGGNVGDTSDEAARDNADAKAAAYKASMELANALDAVLDLQESHGKITTAENKAQSDGIKTWMDKVFGADYKGG